MNAKQIVTWIKEKLGAEYLHYNDPFWIEHPYALGNSEFGFEPAYEINYDLLEKEMDIWINETFPK